jgi:CDP-diacylglycerol---glycerol-3-phosphate 3-phosphatidyltransferase
MQCLPSRTLSVLRLVPMALVMLRAVIAVLLLMDAWGGKVGNCFVAGYVIAAFSDYIDGRIARHLNVTSKAGAMADSCADLVLYGCVIASAYLTHATLIRQLQAPLAAALFVQLLHWTVSMIKFHRMTSYHSNIAKALAYIAFFAVIEIFAFGQSCYIAGAALVLWIICNLEAILITLVLPYCAHDVSDLRSAIAFRQSVKT